MEAWENESANQLVCLWEDKDAGVEWQAEVYEARTEYDRGEFVEWMETDSNKRRVKRAVVDKMRDKPNGF